MSGPGKVVTCAALAALAPAFAGAATIIETDGSAGRASILYVTDEKVRVENEAQVGRVTLFDRAAGELVFIDHSAEQYRRVDRDEMRQIADKVERTREQLEKRIEQMAPEHRERMRERLAEMPSSDDASAIRVEADGSGTAAGISCQEATVHLDDEPSHAVCVASAQNIGLSPGGFRTLEEMFAFFGEMTAGMSESKAELGPRTTSAVIRELDGIPVRSEALESGTSWSVTAVHETSLPPEQFRVPPDYHEVDPLAHGGS